MGFGTLGTRVSAATVAGVDLALDQPQWASARCARPRAESRPGERQALPLRSASFDRVVSVEMMEHVFRPDRPR